MREAGGVGASSFEFPHATTPRHAPHVRSATAAADARMGVSTVTLIKLCAALLVVSSSVVADASASRRVPDRAAVAVVRMAGDSLVARHQPMPQGGWAWRSATKFGKGKPPDDYVRESIVKPDAFIVPGFRNAMPAFQGRLTDKQIQALVDYLLKNGGG